MNYDTESIRNGISEIRKHGGSPTFIQCSGQDLNHMIHDTLYPNDHIFQINLSKNIIHDITDDRIIKL
jgi:hypothetical protein